MFSPLPARLALLQAFDLAQGIGLLFKFFQLMVLMATTDGVDGSYLGSNQLKPSLAYLANYVANHIIGGQFNNPPIAPGLFANNQKGEEYVFVFI